jgi:hypothetical protein
MQSNSYSYLQVVLHSRNVPDEYRINSLVNDVKLRLSQPSMFAFATYIFDTTSHLARRAWLEPAGAFSAQLHTGYLVITLSHGPALTPAAGW